MKWITSIKAAGAAALLGLGLMAAPAAAMDEPLKVGFVYVGPVGDHGWTYAHDQARLYMEETLGDAVETTFIENVSEGADAERAIERLAREGHELIFTTSFGFMNPTITVAQRFPDVAFEHATGYRQADNVSSYNGRFYEARYVLGQIAASVSEAGVAGYVASYPIPEVISGINAFMLGAQSVNPDFEIKIIWVNTWYDPAVEANAASALLDQGADITVQHTDSTAPLQVAQERGALGFGNDSDMHSFAPDAQLSAIVNNWGPYYVQRAQAVIDGTWEMSNTLQAMSDGMVSLAEFRNMPEDVATAAAETRDAIIAGDFPPFTGPIFNQAGEEVVAEGEVASDEMILSMDWYVQGIDDAFPQ